MKNILLLTKTNIKRNKLAVLLAVAGAFILCFILWSLGNLIADQTDAKISIGVIDYDQSTLSGDFKNYLAEDLNYDLLENKTYEELSSVLIDRDISVIIEIPEDFYQQYASGNKKNVIVTSLDDYENAAFIQVYINNYLSSIKILSNGAEGDRKIFDQLLSDYDNDSIRITQSEAVKIDKKVVADKAGFINAVGFYLMIIFAISVLLAFMVVEDRLSGVFNRIQVTPVKPIQYIVGTGIFGLLICFIQIGLFCVYIAYAHIETGVPMYLILLLMGLFSLFTVSFTIAIAVVLKSKNSASSSIIGFSTIGCILGGAYFPIDMAPKTLQNLAKILPQYWFMNAFRNLQVDITANILPNIMILLLFSILFLLIGAVLFAQNYKNN